MKFCTYSFYSFERFIHRNRPDYTAKYFKLCIFGFHPVLFFSANWKINSAFYFTIENVPIHSFKENNIKKESIILLKIKDTGDSSIILRSDQTTYNLSKRVIYTNSLLQIKKLF